MKLGRIALQFTMICVGLLVAFEALSQKAGSPSVLDPRSTAINGITIISTENEIVKRLGKPRSIKSGFSEVVTKPDKYLHYIGLKIYLVEGKIYGLSCTDGKCRTERGVAVGDSKSKVIEIYGNGYPPYKGASHDSLKYQLRGFDSYLVFQFKEGKVQEIQFWVDYV